MGQRVDLGTCCSVDCEGQEQSQVAHSSGPTMLQWYFPPIYSSQEGSQFLILAEDVSIILQVEAVVQRTTATLQANVCVTRGNPR